LLAVFKYYRMLKLLAVYRYYMVLKQLAVCLLELNDVKVVCCI
jgi:hypothetical protein